MRQAHLDSGLEAGAVFDRLASTYDQDFTNSLIGRAQRNIVWKHLLKTFAPGANLLELNCGTGEDALFLGQHGRSVFACDASAQMIARAEQRLHLASPTMPVTFSHLPTERIHELDPSIPFDGAFSNFSGLNCVEDLAGVARSLASLVKPGDKLLFCLSTRVCLAEILYYLANGKTGKAFRRLKPAPRATLNGASLPVFYPTRKTIANSFKPYFTLRATLGIGVAIPPSYLEPWMRRHPSLLRLLARIEPLLSSLPILRTTGDHMLLTFERVSS